MQEIQGFCTIKKNATTCKGARNPEEFMGKTCAVLEFGFDGCVLVLNPQSTAIGMFDKEDVEQSFRCKFKSDIVMPPDIDVFEEMVYIASVLGRKGGYNRVLRDMVIFISLQKGKFTDSLLWAKQ